MAFQIRLFTFPKKRNSTARPAANGGSPYNCIAKQPLDIINPRLQLQLAGGATANPHAWNYCYIPAFERYYYITGWNNNGPLWECSLAVDALASWRNSIGAQSLYVFRSSAAFDREIPDNMYPAKDHRQSLNINLPRLFTIGGANYNGLAAGGGFFIVGVIGSRGTEYLAMSPAEADKFITQLFSDKFYEDVLGEFGATEYPEAKVAINPAQYIASIKFFPGSVNNTGVWGIQYQEIVFGVSAGPTTIGTVDYPAMIESYLLSSGTAPTANTICEYSITLTDAMKHPQAEVRGEWLNYSPYTTYELFYPPFGLIQLDTRELEPANALVIRISLDARTCIATLDVFARTTTGITRDRSLARVQAPFAVDVPVSNILQPGTSITQIASAAVGGVLGIIGGAIGGNGLAVAGGVASASNGVGNALVQGQIPHLSTVGGAGNTASLAGTPALYVSHWTMADDDNAGRGRPLCAMRQLSTIPGYIMADPDELSIAATDSELQTIRAAIAGGFFYE